MKSWLYLLPVAILLLIFSQLDISGALPATYAKPIQLTYSGVAEDYMPRLEDLPQGYSEENDLLPRSVRSRLRPYRNSMLIQGYDRNWIDTSGLPLKVLYGVILLSGAASNTETVKMTRYDNLIQEGMELIKPLSDKKLTWESEPVVVDEPSCHPLSAYKILSDAEDGNVYLFAHCQMDNLIFMLWLRLRASDLSAAGSEVFLADTLKQFLDTAVVKAQMRQEGIAGLDFLLPAQKPGKAVILQ